MHILDIPGWVFVFRQDGVPAHRAHDTVAVLERKVLDFIPPTMWPTNLPDLNPVYYIHVSVVYCRRKFTHRELLLKVDEVNTGLIAEWEHFHQSIVDAAMAE